MQDGRPPWYIVVRADNGYPQLVFADKDRADSLASTSGAEVVTVMPVSGKKKQKPRRDKLPRNWKKQRTQR